jgi:methyl-accepting chemotaxis protein
MASNTADTQRDPAILRANLDNAAKLESLVLQYDQAAEVVKQFGLAGDAKGADAALKDVIPLTGEITGLMTEMTNTAVELIQAESDNMDIVSRNVTILLIAVTVVCVGISMALALYVSGLISKPLKTITAFMTKAGTTGDITLRPEDVAMIGKLQEAKDEIGELTIGCAGFVKHVTTVSKNLDTIADGDLTVNVELLTEDDVMGKSLQQMIAKLGDMFGNIKAATEQVSSGSVQIADGAQLLAQGATQQSATVQELAASVTEVNGQTKANAGLANDAKKLGDDIKINAERGNVQMEQMIKAVGEISDASTAIGRVIKIIDDIAFQTNILALNAAVEAARAGQHGKGFAVVADEVRSLAAKSAEAAKNTSELIATSIQKSEQGASISKETAESLSQIVGGIVQSSELVAKIAASSNEQSRAIGQIGEAINQVSQVIQQNSATAEESAAASEEMSGMATRLQHLIAQFKLKNTQTPASTGMALGAEKY